MRWIIAGLLLAGVLGCRDEQPSECQPATIGGGKTTAEESQSSALDPKLPAPDTGHAGSILCSVFSPDGKTLVTGSDNTTLKLWDVTTGWHRATFSGHEGSVLAMAFSADGKMLAAAGGTTIKLWDVEAGKGTRVCDVGIEVWPVAFSPDSRSLAIGCQDSTIRIWDIAAGKESAALKGHRQDMTVESIAFSPDGRLLASAAGASEIKLWHVSTGESTTLFDEFHQWTGLRVTFSPEGRTVASAGSLSIKTITLWDTGSGKKIITLGGNHQCGVAAFVFTPDGRSIVSVGRRGTVKRGEVATGKNETLFTLPADPWVGAASVSPDGKTLAASLDGGKTIKLWDVTTGKSIDTSP